jgi:hypothetical protein
MIQNVGRGKSLLEENKTALSVILLYLFVKGVVHNSRILSLVEIMLVFLFPIFRCRVLQLIPYRPLLLSVKVADRLSIRLDKACRM